MKIKKEARNKIVAEQRRRIPSQPKEEMISMRLTKGQLDKLDAYRDIIEKNMGLPVTRGWVVTRLIELGTPAFEKLYLNQ